MLDQSPAADCRDDVMEEVLEQTEEAESSSLEPTRVLEFYSAFINVSYKDIDRGVLHTER